MAPKKLFTTIKYSVPGTQPPIFLAGSFSSPEWQPAEMDYTTDEKNEHEFYKEVEVEGEKEYQYKFRIGLGDWWILNEGSPTATDNAGNRNNIISIPHQKEAERETEKPADGSSFLPLVHEETSPAQETPEQVPESETTKEDNPIGEHTFLRQHDGSIDDNGEISIALPAGIESLTPSSVPKTKDTEPQESSPVPEVVTEETSSIGDDMPKHTEQMEREPVMESNLDIQDGRFFQKEKTEATKLDDADSSEKHGGDSTADQVQDEDKTPSRPSTSSTTSDPVNQSDHSDGSFVLVPQHVEDGVVEDAGGETNSIEKDPKPTEDEEVSTSIPVPQGALEPETEKVEDSTATAKSPLSDEFDAGATPTVESGNTSEIIPNNHIEDDIPSIEQPEIQVSDELAGSDTSKIVVGLQQSFDGTAAPSLPLPITPFVVGNKQLGHDEEKPREILAAEEGPSIIVQPATPGPASLLSKQLGDTSSTVADETSSQMTKRRKQASVNERSASPSSVQTMGRDKKPQNLLKVFLHLVFVEWIGKLVGKLWNGFKRQPSNEKLKIVASCSAAVLAYIVLYR